MRSEIKSQIARVVAEELVTLAQVTASVALYCDRLEHADRADRGTVASAAATLLRSATRLAENADLDIVECYASRLEAIEAASVLETRCSIRGASRARTARTWRELQMVQVDHDRFFHPDVWGLARMDQIRHCVFHLAKITGALADVQSDLGAWTDFENRRLPDLLLFGLKFATVTGQRLPDEVLPAAESHDVSTDGQARER
jgi:hypothetical protein